MTSRGIQSPSPPADAPASRKTRSNAQTTQIRKLLLQGIRALIRWQAENGFGATWRGVGRPTEARGLQHPAEELIDALAGLEFAAPLDLPVQANAGILEHPRTHGFAQML